MKKAILISILVFVALSMVIFYRLKAISNNLAIEVAYEGINLETIDITQLLANQSYIQVLFGIRIFNSNRFKIPIKNMTTSVFYKSKYVGGSVAAKNIDLLPNQLTKFTENINLFVKGEIIKQMFGDISAGRDPELEYEISLKLFGIRYRFREKIKLIKNLTA